ncbi:50S ribosomal protein L3 [Candidatus Margulisiibacteriota bacterium]
MNGLIGKKIGMTQIFDSEGRVVPVTVIEAGPCLVAQIKTKEKDGYTALQLGFMTEKKPNKPQAGHNKELEFQPKHLMEFRADSVDGVIRGQKITVEIFNAGEQITISGISVGKGFAGTVKRWNFARGPMSHGSKSHRLPGSIGAGTTPSRVFKGLKMAGRMGGATVTEIKEIVKIDKEKHLILIKGAVVGPKNGILAISKNG